jgi:NitT/TauT family transport system substrate-binding protein
MLVAGGVPATTRMCLPFKRSMATVASSPATVATIGLTAPANIMTFLPGAEVMLSLLCRKKDPRGNGSYGIMKHSAVLLLTAAIVIASNVAHSEVETIRVAVQKTGTFAWELAVIRAHALERQANLSIRALELASPEAGKIALRAGSVDIIISDWIWVSRERSLGAKLTFYPYSSALGAVMVPDSSSIQTLVDLKGRKLAVAGGPLDKSWLLLQAWLKQGGTDLKAESSIVYGAPPLLAEKALGGEMDAVLNYWYFCAALEARGFRRVADIEEILPKLGAKGRTAMIGYVFDEGWGNAHPELMARFIAMTRAAKEILSASDTEWERIQPLTGAVDVATLRAYRDHYREGIPRRPVADEEADARVLYRVLATIGGRELVGPAGELDSGTFYHAIPGD